MSTADIIANMVTETGGARPYQVRPTPVESLNPLAQLFIDLLAAVEQEVEGWESGDGEFEVVYVCDTLNTVFSESHSSHQTRLDALALWEHAAVLVGVSRYGVGWWPQTERGMECRIAAVKEAVRLASQGWTP